MKIRYLHLSDLNITGKASDNSANTFNLSLVTGSMITKIKDFKELKDGIDFIIITGDLAYSGKAEEFDAAEKFCTELLNSCGLTNEQIFIVPGNHDLDRDGINESIKRMYSFNTQDGITEILTHEITFPAVFKKFEAFNTFASKVTGKERFNTETIGFYENLTIERGVHTCNINLIGLNSSLFAGYEGDDKQKLALGLYQIAPHLKVLNNKNISIGFFHHPFSCYHPADKVCESKLMVGLDIILTGHCHVPENMSLVNSSGHSVLISAGASFETRESCNSFNVVEIDTGTGVGKVMFYKYLPEKDRWVEDRDVNPDDKDGFFPFQIERIAKAGNKQSPPLKPLEPNVEIDDHAGTVDYVQNEVLSAYRNMLVNQLQPLPLSGIDVGSSDAANNREKTELDNVYIELDTKAIVGKGDKKVVMGEDIEMRSVSALEAAAGNRCLVILGDPGSGKSTFINHLALMFATQKGYKDIKDVEGSVIWPEMENEILPVHIVLRDFVKSISASDKKAKEIHLWKFICRRLKEQKFRVTYKK